MFPTHSDSKWSSWVRSSAGSPCATVLWKTPDVPAVLAAAKARGVQIDPANVTYILSNNTLIPTPGPAMALWRKKLFAFLSRNALRPTQFFRLPANRVIELGMQIKL
jgi:KUP system potassium uptake protein